MATTTSTMTSGVDKPWTLTKTLTTQTFNATLTTNGKYLDRDINIDISTKDGVNKLVVPKAADIKTIKPVIIDAGDDAALTVTPVIVKPESGTYIALKTNGDSATVTVTAQIVEDGFLKTSDTKQENIVVNVSASDVAYIPLAGTSASANADYGALSNYFNKQGSPEGADVTIQPNYSIPNAGYIGEADRVVTNPSYWAVKKGLVTGWNKAQTDAPGTVNKITGVTAVESGGALHIAEGWYENSYITLADIIPDSLNIDAVDGSMLYGHQAFNEKGETLTGSILTYSSAQGAGLTHTTDKNDFYVDGDASGATQFGVIPAHSYVNEKLSIKEGSLGAITLSGSVKPSIAAVTSASVTGAKNITTSASEVAPASAYYVAVQSNAGQADASYDLDVTAGWITGGRRHDVKTNAITLNQSNVTYAPVAAGTVTVAGGDINTDSSSNTIKTSGMTDGLSAQPTEYKIDASAAFKASRAAVSLTATDGYIEKANVDDADALAVASISENKDAATVYLKKAVITSTGTESVKPSITTGFDGGAIATMDDESAGYSFPITITTNATVGSVATRYSASAGYSPAVSDVASGAVEVVADVQSPTITKYVKKGSVSASTRISSQTDEYLTTTAEGDTPDVSIITPVTVDPGYVQTGNGLNATAHYTIKKTQLAGSASADVSISKKSGDTTFSSKDGVALHTAAEEGKTYKTITAVTTINVDASSSGTASVAGKASGWIAGEATATVTGKGNDSVSNSQDIYIEVYAGEFTFEA